MTFRDGSIVNITLAEAGGPGSGDSTLTNVEILDLSRDGITYLYTVLGQTFFVPWQWVRQLKLVTH